MPDSKELDLKPFPIGCLFDATPGYNYNARRVIKLAEQLGADFPSVLADGSNLSCCEDKATDFLNQFAADGHFVGWRKGEFGHYEDTQ